MQIRTFQLPANAPRQSVAAWLRKELEISASLCRRLRDAPGRILCNGQPVRTDAVPLPGDVLSADLSDAFLPKDVPISSGNKAEILYEDDWLLCCDKPAGILTHASTLCPGEEDLRSLLAAACGRPIAFHPVNRLDRNTSGAMAVALCGYAHDLLKRRLHTPDLRRAYLCICEGVPKMQSGIIDAPIARKADSVIARCVSENGSPAQTAFRVLSENGKQALVLVIPETGRTHQIRVHMAHIGCPLTGDFLYGQELPGVRFMLHSYALQLRHPVTGALVFVHAPIPEDFMKMLSDKKLEYNVPEELFA